MCRTTQGQRSARALASSRNNWENSQKRTGVWIGVDASEKASLVEILGLRELRLSHMHPGMLRSIWMSNGMTINDKDKGRQEGLFRMLGSTVHTLVMGF